MPGADYPGYAQFECLPYWGWSRLLPTHHDKNYKQTFALSAVTSKQKIRKKMNDKYHYGIHRIYIITSRVIIDTHFDLKFLPKRSEQGRILDFFLERGALVSCSTSTLINHIVFFFAEYQLY